MSSVIGSEQMFKFVNAAIIAPPDFCGDGDDVGSRRQLPGHRR